MSFSTIPLPNSNLSSNLTNNTTVPWWDGFYTYGTTFNLAAALANTSSENYALLVYDMDVIAWKLLVLQAYNIPVIWRPLHEADGGWSWWGAYGPESCIEQDLGFWNHLGVVVNWLLGKLLGACKMHLVEALGEASRGL
jgi:hypothetical protein